MLQMSCPNCNGVVSSLFLADVETVECSQCKKNIPVSNITITAQHFTVNREDFLRRTFRFQRLLREVEKDLLLMSKDQGTSKKSMEKLEQFRDSLQELLDGARDSYRMEIPSDLYVEVNAQNNIIRGKLLNLSAEGCSIELLMYDTIPRKGSEVNIEFFFPESSEALNTRAKVIWSNGQLRKNDSESATVGLTFTKLNETTRDTIWNYIINNTPIRFDKDQGTIPVNSAIR